MAQQRDYYSILQVKRGASQEAIKASYLRLAELYAPASRKKSRARAAARMREIEAAFSVLSDRAKRARYDRRLAGARHLSQPGVLNRGPLWLSRAVPAFLSRPSSLVALPSSGLAVFIIVTVLLSVLGGNGGEIAASSQPSPPAGSAGPGNTAPVASPKVSDENGDEAPEGFTRFTSDVKGYSIVYPDGWGTEEGAYGADVFWEFHPRPELTDNNVSVLCEEIEPDLADEYVGRNVELLRSAAQARDVQIVDDKLRIGGSSSGALLHWSTSIGEEEIEISQAAVGIDGCGWVLTLTTRAGLREEYEPTFFEMIRSFRVGR